MRRKHFTIVPVKPFCEGKSRLASLLALSERLALNAFFFESTMKVAAEFSGAASTIVVSRSEEVLQTARQWGARAVRERGSSLNAAVSQATQIARVAGATSILILPTDLPFATPTELRHIVSDYAGPRMVIVPDRSGVGTNILFLSPPGLDRYWFGRTSFDLHRSAGRKSGLHVVERRVAALEFDIDTPEHYRLWRKTIVTDRMLSSASLVAIRSSAGVAVT